MPRMNRIVRFSLPSQLAEEYESLARELGRNKTKLFREMMAVYKGKQEEEELYRLQRGISRQLKRPKPFTRRQIEQIVSEGR